MLHDYKYYILHMHHFLLEHALTVHWHNYGEKMIFVLTVDPNVIPDYNNLCTNFEKSLQLIKEAVVQRGLEE